MAMNATKDSRVLRRVAPLFQASVVGRAAMRVTSAVRPFRQVRSRRRLALQPPLGFDEVADSQSDSRLATFASRTWTILARAGDDAQTTLMWRRASTAIRDLDRTQRVAVVAWGVATAAFTHLLMLFVVEQYHFPRRVTLVLPLVIAVIALVVFARSGEIARARRDRQQR